MVPLIKKMNYKTELQGFRQGLHHLRHKVLMVLCFVGLNLPPRMLRLGSDLNWFFMLHLC